MSRTTALFLMAVTFFLAGYTKQHQGTYSNPLVHTGWIELSDLPSADLVGKMYGLTSNTTTEDLLASINAEYRPQDPQKYFRTKGRRFYAEWKVSFESGIPITNGWTKGLREYYVFAPLEREECLVIKLTKSRITTIYHQFHSGSQVAITPGVRPSERPEPSPKKHRRSEPLNYPDEGDTSTSRISLVDLFRADRNDQGWHQNNKIWKSLPLDYQILERVYSFSWGATPREVMVSPKFLAGLSPISGRDLKNYLGDNHFLGYANDLFEVLATAKHAEINALELGPRTYYLFGRIANKRHHSWGRRPEMTVVVLEFETEQIQKITQMYSFADEVSAVILTEPMRPRFLFHRIGLRHFFFAAAVLLTLYCLWYSIARPRLKNRRYRPFVASAGRSSQPRTFPQGTYSAEPGQGYDFIDADVIDHDEG